ncbi:MAG: DUF4240 domain-containing protein [Candidatus Melainabacteria bacterium]|nr:MAG: DUF4240 domain-containing protein [Candidatus Melainabacteria bacterium]
MNLVFKYDNTEDDHITAFSALLDEHGGDEHSITQELWSKLRYDSYLPLTKSYIEANEVGKISDYLLEQFDNGIYGFEFFTLVSDALIANGDKNRLTDFWKSIVLTRFSHRHYEAVGKSLQLMRDAFLKLEGSTEEVDELQSQLEIKRQRRKKRQSPAPPENRVAPSELSETRFWNLIGQSKRHEENSYAQVLLRTENLRDSLSRLTATEIKQFADIFRQKLNESYTWELWALAYIAFGGCSDDGFEYFRTWLISEGQEVFERLIDKPESILQLGIRPCKLESMLYVPEELYSEMTGEVLELSVPSLTEPSGVEWEESEEVLQELYPAIYKHFSK